MASSMYIHYWIYSGVSVQMRILLKILDKIEDLTFYRIRILRYKVDKNDKDNA